MQFKLKERGYKDIGDVSVCIICHFVFIAPKSPPVGGLRHAHENHA